MRRSKRWPIFTGAWLLSCFASLVNADDVVVRLGLTEVLASMDEASVSFCLPSAGSATDPLLKRRAALLACLKLPDDADLAEQQFRAHPKYGPLFGENPPNWPSRRSKDIAAFEALLADVLEAQISTGYNIVPELMWPSFDASRTVVYGHSDWQHARQLVALLETRGLQFTVTPLLKQSAFVYRDDWGEPSSPLHKLANGMGLVKQVEYDLFFEFEQAEDVARFAELVTRYAKKDSADEPGLLYGAWWQPFYRTFQATSSGRPLTVLLVRYAGLRANLIALPEEAPAKLKELRRLHDNWQVTPIQIWVNPAFYRFQLGDYL